MKKARESMFLCSSEAASKDQRKLYDSMHKKMKKIQKDWNRIEQQRECYT